MLVTWFFLLLFKSLEFNDAVDAQLLANYHQNDYDVKLERCEILRFNHTYYRSFKGECVPYNRTHRAVNTSAYLLMNQSNNIKLEVQLYKFMSNEYRFFPLTLNVNACYELHRNTFKSRTILQKTSNIGECPWKKGYNYIKNGALDYSALPPYIPRGSYKMETNFYDNLKFMFEFDAYFTIVDKPFKWEE